MHKKTYIYIYKYINTNTYIHKYVNNKEKMGLKRCWIKKGGGAWKEIHKAIKTN